MADKLYPYAQVIGVALIVVGLWGRFGWEWGLCATGIGLILAATVAEFLSVETVDDDDDEVVEEPTG